MNEEWINKSKIKKKKHMDNQSMIISLFTPNYGINLYLALAMNAMKYMSLVLPNLSNFQEKKKSLNIYVKFFTIFNIGKSFNLI